MAEPATLGASTAPVTTDWFPPPDLQTPAVPGPDPFVALGPDEIRRRVPDRVQGWTAEVRAERFEAWSRELSGAQLAAAAHALPDESEAAELVQAVRTFGPPLVRTEFGVALQRLATGPERAAARDHLHRTAADMGLSPSDPAAHAQAFKTQPALMAVPTLNEHLRVFGREPRIANTRAELMTIVARGMGWNPEARAPRSLQALEDGRAVTPETRALWEAESRDLRAQPAPGLDPAQRAHVTRLVETIRAQGEGGSVSVTVLPVVHPLPGGEPGVVSEPLFKVQGSEGRVRYVDAQGARYDTIAQYLEAPSRPRGVPIVLPTGRFEVDARGNVRPWVTQAAPSVLRSPDGQAVAMGVTAAGTLVSYTGAGAVAGVPAALGGAYLLASHADRIGWTMVHAPDQLDPLDHPQMLVDVGSLALGVTGLGQATARALGRGLSEPAAETLAMGNRVMAGLGLAQAAPEILRGDALAGADALSNAAAAVLGHKPVRGGPAPAVHDHAPGLKALGGGVEAGPGLGEGSGERAAPPTSSGEAAMPPLSTTGPTARSQAGTGSVRELTASQRALYMLPSSIRSDIKRAKELADIYFGRKPYPPRPPGFDALVGEPPTVLQQRVVRVGDEPPAAPPERWIDPSTPGVKPLHSAIVEAPTIEFNRRPMRVGYNFEDRSAEIRTDGKGHYWLGDPDDPRSALVSATLDGNIIRNVIYRRELAGPGSTDDFSLACSLLKRLHDDGIEVVGIEMPESLRKNQQLLGNLRMIQAKTSDGQLRYMMDGPERPHFKPHGLAVEEGVVFESQFSNEVTYPERAQQLDLSQGRHRLIYVVTEQGELRYSPDRGGPMFMFSGILNPNFVRHSDLAGGGRVYAAGEAVVENGKLVQLDNNSGHYLTYGDSAAYWALKAFGEQVDIGEARYIEHIGFGRSDATLPARRHYDVALDRWLAGAPTRVPGSK